MASVQGQRLYARAKADVDGLIALLVVDLAGDRSPAAIPELRHRLAAVPRQRRALCREVEATVRDVARERGPAHAVDLLTEGVDDALSPPIDAAVQLWTAYRHAGEAERTSITSALEEARWRDYAAVPGK